MAGAAEGAAKVAAEGAVEVAAEGAAEVAAEVAAKIEKSFFDYLSTFVYPVMLAFVNK
ncbi:MAG: hypothetical protein LBH39_03910 [Clostridiales Family XIII bacterium]|nr:hypothetical protein [Clostridiales Family XIII bacterium]